MTSGPLDGVRVVEAANWLAAPAAAALMADLGADVIKVEPPGGDAFRGVLQARDRDASLLPGFELDNRGKRSVTINLERPGGPDLLLRLCRRADVFITNLTRDRVERYGLEYDAVRAASPRIVYAAFSGYGSHGPDADRRGFDFLAFWTRGGVMSVLGTPDGPPVIPRAGQGDHVATLNLLAAILAALRLRDHSGEAQRVDVNLLQTGVWTIGSDVSRALISREQPPRTDRTTPVNPISNTYQTRDGRWILLSAPQAERFWPGFCEAIGEPEWASDPRYASLEGLMEHAAELRVAIDERFRRHDLDYWAEQLDRHGLLWAPMAELPEVIDDPQLRALGAFTTVEHPQAGTFETIAAPFQIENADIRVRGAAPAAGEHTAEVLEELGLGADEVAELAQQGIFG